MVKMIEVVGDGFLSAFAPRNDHKKAGLY
jgi:hypothetical protein